MVVVFTCSLVQQVLKMAFSYEYGDDYWSWKLKKTSDTGTLW